MIFLVTVHIIISMFLYSLTVFLLIFLMSIAKAYALLAPVFKRARNVIPLTFTITIGWITSLFWAAIVGVEFPFLFFGNWNMVFWIAILAWAFTLARKGYMSFPQAVVAEFVSYHYLLSFRYFFDFVTTKDSVTFTSTADVLSSFVVTL